MHDRYERIALEFEAGVYQIGRTHFPNNARILDALATSLAGLRRHGDALDAIEELIALEPRHPRYLYNRACALSGLGRLTDALDSLKLAVRWGFDDFDYLTRDADLASLRSLPQFDEYRTRARVQRTRTFVRAE